MNIRDLTGFLSELTEHNARGWFVMNQPRYDILRAEFLQLVTALISSLAKFDAEVSSCNPRKALFRFHRDLRFSHDKRPYKTTFSAAITASGLKRPSQGGGPMYYLQINAAGLLTLGVGEFLPPAARLRIIRQQILADSEGFSKLLRNHKLVDNYGGLRKTEKLVRVPKGYAADAPHAEYLKLKSFVASKELSLTQMGTEELVALMSGEFQNAYALVAWLRTCPTT